MTELLREHPQPTDLGRGQHIGTSHLHDIHRLVEARSEPTVALHVGEPHIRMPQVAADAYVGAIRDGHTSYTDAPGILALREILAERHSLGHSPEFVFITPGSCQGIAAVIQSVARNGGSVLLPDIHWPIHLHQTLAAGLEPRFYRLDGIDGDLVTALEQAWDESVRIVLINSPSNPSGRILDHTTLQQVHAWAYRRQLPIISDEAYEDFVYDGVHESISLFDTALAPAERLVYTIRTFSKGYSMTGCRLGYVVAPDHVRAEMLRRIQEATLVAPSTPVQYAGLAALTDAEHLHRHRSHVKQLRDAVCDKLSQAGLLWERPAGGWYVMADLHIVTSDSQRWIPELLNNRGVSIAPGSGFFPPNDSRGQSLARITLCGERTETLEGIERLVDFAKDSAPTALSH
ncbi:pyridoxal phosphate-dependent aminotransferase [Nocardia sp. NPDC005998]|uniref:pyridoxal phosphate-dependent aminotransferase n=1 Tax=Nocardia sp. NPDC005998 TaxID=3156894 RepID=UPI0033A1CB1A